MPVAPAKNPFAGPPPAAGGAKKANGSNAKKPAPTLPPSPPQVKREPPPVPAEEVRVVIYDKVEAQICDGVDAITVALAKTILGWETEKEYQNRMIAENPTTKPTMWVFDETLPAMLRDKENNLVRCWNNLENRPFDEKWSLGLAQTILRGQWAGPLTIPGETINGSTIVVSKTGRVESGQHSLVGLILAYQMWSTNKKAHPFWPEDGAGPVIETILITGISEDPRVLMTVDNCKPRTTADVFYTSPLFRTLIPTERRECSRMMSAGVDTLWTRTAAQGYRTNTEMCGFVERHIKLLDCVKHLFGENKGKGGKGTSRPISNLRLSPGACAALCYLMACSTSDGDVYRNGFPPTEKDLDWKHWKKAREFWALIGGHKSFETVRKALGQLIDSTPDAEDGNVGLGGRMPEKLAIIQKAWDVFRDHDLTTGDPFGDADLAEGGALCLSYNALDDAGNALPDGQVKLLDNADFLGIDVPPEVAKVSSAPEPATPSKEELAAAAEQVRKDRALETAKKLKEQMEKKKAEKR